MDSVDTVLAGRYRPTGLLGRGGMGAVWRARDERLDRTVAVKELRLPDGPGEHQRTQLIARLDREAARRRSCGTPASSPSTTS